MNDIRIRLEDWQTAALASLARARGLDPESMARRLVAEGLAGVADTASRGKMDPRPYLSISAEPTLELRLQRIFGL